MVQLSARARAVLFSAFAAQTALALPLAQNGDGLQPYSGDWWTLNRLFSGWSSAQHPSPTTVIVEGQATPDGSEASQSATPQQGRRHHLLGGSPLWHVMGDVTRTSVEIAGEMARTVLHRRELSEGGHGEDVHADPVKGRKSESTSLSKRGKDDDRDHPSYPAYSLLYSPDRFKRRKGLKKHRHRRQAILKPDRHQLSQIYHGEAWEGFDPTNKKTTTDLSFCKKFRRGVCDRLSSLPDNASADEQEARYRYYVATMHNQPPLQLDGMTAGLA